MASLAGRGAGCLFSLMLRLVAAAEAAIRCHSWNCEGVACHPLHLRGLQQIACSNSTAVGLVVNLARLWGMVGNQGPAAGSLLPAACWQ